MINLLEPGAPLYLKVAFAPIDGAPDGNRIRVVSDQEGTVIFANPSELVLRPAGSELKEKPIRSEAERLAIAGKVKKEETK